MAQHHPRDEHLRTYIEKLLEMRRQEIDDLSITDVSSTSTSPRKQQQLSNHSAVSCSDDTSMGPSTSSSTSVNKTVRFEDEQEENENNQQLALHVRKMML